MSYKVRFGEYEIECETLAEVRALIGADGGGGTQTGNAGRSSGAGSGTPPNRDDALLRALLEAGEGGVEAGVVGGLLEGAKGRGVPFAVKRWAMRVNIASSEDNDAVVPARPGGKRGWRLSGPALAAARALRGGAA